MAGLVRILLTPMDFIRLIPSRLAIGFLWVLGTLLAPTRLPLPTLALAARLLNPFFLHREEVKDLPLRGGERLGDAPVPPERPLGQLLRRKMP